MLRCLTTVAVRALLVGLAGCNIFTPTRPREEPPPPDIQTTAIDYVDSDGFDTLLESALTNQDPVIQIQTGRPKPDWDGRLNGWIAAWNMGGKVAGTVRMQSPLPVTVDGDSIRELRLLIDDLMGSVEGLARRGTSWWASEAVRRRRVDLLKPYNLRFHVGADDNIQIILFNGQYQDKHRGFVEAIAHPDQDNGVEWSRGYSCSQCKFVKRRDKN